MKDGYRPRKSVEPDDGRESEDWPNPEDYDRARQTFSRRAYEAGYKGGDPDGEPLRLARMAECSVEGWVAVARRRSHDAITALKRLIAAAPENTQTAVSHAEDHDRRTAKLAEEADATRRWREDVRDEIGKLSPSQQGRRFEGKEGVLAAASTSLLDGAVFALMLSSLGGALEIRIAVAVGLTTAYTVIVAAAGRLLAEVWRDSRSDRWGGIAAAVLLTALLTLSGAGIASSGEFRADAIVSIGRGIPANPGFLIWVQAALTLAAVCAISAYHVASVGEPLRRKEAELTTLIEQLDDAIEESARAACDARDEALRIKAEAEAAEASLPLMPGRLEFEIDEIKANGKLLVELVFAQFEAGQTRRANEEAARQPFRTIDGEVAETLRRFATRSVGHDGRDN